MVWESWLEAIAPSIGVNAAQAGIIMSFIFIFSFVLMIAIAAPVYANVGIPMAGLIWALFFTYTSWLPIWTGTALSLVLAIWVAISIKEGLS